MFPGLLGRAGEMKSQLGCSEVTRNMALSVRTCSALRCCTRASGTAAGKGVKKVVVAESDKRRWSTLKVGVGQSRTVPVEILRGSTAIPAAETRSDVHQMLLQVRAVAKKIVQVDQQ